MAVKLTKGGTVNLSKEASSNGVKLDRLAVGLGWDVCEEPYKSFDLDVWALAITTDGIKKKNLVYYGNKVDSSQKIVHCGDNLTGEGDGDDETININLSELPENYKSILIGVTIYDATRKKQSFKDVNNAFIRIYDRTTSKEICKYSDEFKAKFGEFATVLFGVLRRNGNTWEFCALSEGSKVGAIYNVPNAFSTYALDESCIKSNENNNNGGKKMAVSLSKGGKVSLAKVAAEAGISGGLTKITVGLGWDTNRYDGGAAFDLDAAAFMLNASGKVRNENDFIFYNNLQGQGVTHTGDNRTGDGDGDDEQINVDLTAIPADVEKVSFTVTIDQAEARNQNFGMVENAYIRVVDTATNTELLKYDLCEDFSVETAIVVAEIYRHNGEWKFNAVGSGFSGGLAALCANFGINVG